MTEVAPWQVWLMKLDPQMGNEQAGIRPVIVVGSLVMLEVAPRLVMIVPCTTRLRGAPFQPTVMLREESAVMCEQVKSLSRDRLVKLLPYKVPNEVRNQIRWHINNLLA